MRSIKAIPKVRVASTSCQLTEPLIFVFFLIAAMVFLLCFMLVWRINVLSTKKMVSVEVFGREVGRL
jgi:hypothetical protein